MGAKTAGLQAAPIPFISEKRGLIVLGRFDGVLLVSDFDDTLYDPQLRIPPRNLQALDCFLRGGGRFTVATGRAHTTFAPYAGLAPINAPVILSNGSALYDFQAGRMLYQTFLSPQAPDDLGALTRTLPELGFEAYHGEDIYVFRPNWVTWMHMKKVGSHCTVCAIEEMPTPWTKVIVQQEHDQLLRAQAWLEDHGLQQNLTVETLGDIRLISGNAVKLRDTGSGVTGLFWIESDTHTWKNGQYYCKAKLNFRNLADDTISGSELK